MSLNHDKTSQDWPTSTSQDSPSSSKWEESMDLTPWEESMVLTLWEEWMDLTPGESSAEEDSDLQENTVTSTVAEVQITDAAPPPLPPHPALEVTIFTEGNTNPAPKAAAAANAGETEPATPTSVDLTLESSSEEEMTYMRAYECFHCGSLISSMSLMYMKSHAQSVHPEQGIIVRDSLAYKRKLPSQLYVCPWVGCPFSDLDHMVYVTHLNAHQNGNK